MKYIVIEIQNDGNQMAHLFDAFDDENQARSKYYTILAAAAVSKLKAHTALLCDEYGGIYESRCFRHEEE